MAADATKLWRILYFYSTFCLHYVLPYILEVKHEEERTL